MKILWMILLFITWEKNELIFGIGDLVRRQNFLIKKNLFFKTKIISYTLIRWSNPSRSNAGSTAKYPLY